MRQNPSPSRRDFLRGTGATVAAVAALPLLEACTHHSSTAKQSSSPATTTGAASTSAGPTSTATVPAGAAEPGSNDGTGHGAFGDQIGWGVATSAFQIEGATRADGRGMSIWDTFCKVKGNIADGSTADVADDHYHRYKADVALMKSMNVRSYRFSVAWPRIFPDGFGTVNQKGLDFYRKLVDELLAAKIRPVVTLFHWDLPQVLQDLGGWENRDVAQHFADYSGVVAKALGGDVPVWLTINEPKTITQLGYIYGTHAPGIRDKNKAYTALHHMLLGHGLAGQAVHANAPAKVKVGPALNLMPCYGADTSDAARDAARKLDLTENKLYLDAVFLGSYPEEALAELPPGVFDTVVKDGDMKTIASAHDVFGLQYYNPFFVTADGQIKKMHSTSAASWQELWPQGMYDVCQRVVREYGKVPILVTECGVATKDVPDKNGLVNDTVRIQYLTDTINWMSQATTEGVQVESFHIWSLLDNFEWAEGYTQRWGLVRVDYKTQRRIPKKSVEWFRKVVKNNGVSGLK